MNYKRRKKEKIGLVVTGGGMRCAYSGGALLALHEVYELDEPHALGAGSGSAGNAFYYLAKQYDVAHPMWTDYVYDKKFLKPYGAVDVDYLIDTIFKQKAPLNTDALDATKTKYFIPVTNYDTGSVEYITNKSPYDYYEILRAAKALPIAYNKKVHLGLRRYIDGEVAETIAELARKVLSTGVTSLITINCEPPRRNTVTKVFLGARALTSRPALRRAILRDLSIPPGLCPTDTKARAYCISPSKKLPVDSLRATKRGLSEAFDLGYADVANSPELKKLFSAI